ncbi:ABC transporter ATP-binding protein [Streptomyces sp. VRA16 Mangrove soil]|uniref:ABC transporter ATP-binding protein n=1 Tax=Streptomyces sp. VRA16 Mangrove soil TaxID=2817434 RepID=UPI001A9FEBB1|nr:ABC transporter ATP-binding protein [Streptomyces sp. VRA16 Mangrove soil]MBO1329653.1 ABC transporter ATP-binding protein [Streptomyces sp. VRA16 Mangrove soil]
MATGIGTGGTTGDGTPAIRLRGLRKSFGDVHAVDGVELDVAEGEFFSLLGPSGSGKTTVLRLIAGFETPTDGTVSLAGEDVTRRAPFERDVTTVFQDYALFPHMTVEQNIAYGLKVRGASRKERAARARAALASVRLEGFGGRRPDRLSGGQRQRVALARALVVRPRVLLLDEPLGALDLKLREQMQSELKELQRDVGITFVLVTHDQAEALALSDRVAVMNAGRVEQVGTPGELYEAPASAFVASFVGTSNTVTGPAAELIVGKPGTFGVRPEKIRVLAADAEQGRTGRGDHSEVHGTVADAVYLGDHTRVVVDTDAGERFVVVRQNLDTSAADALALPGTRVLLRWHRRHNIPLHHAS